MQCANRGVSRDARKPNASIIFNEKLGPPVPQPGSWGSHMGDSLMFYRSAPQLSRALLSCRAGRLRADLSPLRSDVWMCR